MQNIYAQSYERDSQFPIYEDMVNQFIRTGYYDESLLGNPITDYLIGVFGNPNIQLKVLTDKVFATIFKDHLLRFVDMVLNRVKFDFARKQAEMKGVAEAIDWSPDARWGSRDDSHSTNGQQALLDQLGENYDRFGLHSEYYRKEFDKGEKTNEEIWASINRDYQVALSEHFRDVERREIAQSGEMTLKKIEDHSEKAREFNSENGVSDGDFQQIWNLTGGLFMPHEMRRLLKLVRLQDEHPELVKVANRMGHVLDSDGTDTLEVALGNVQDLVHSSRSDIEGITVGRDVSSMLPVDKALMADDSLDDLFVYKYITGSLQNFRYKSESTKPMRSLISQKARPHGPMVACIDTSGSMKGRPTDIARSLLMKLVCLAETQRRDLYVIAFSVATRPFDTKRERPKLLDFFKNDMSGDTDATKMLEQLFDLIDCNEHYMAADVVLLSDFYIPMVRQELVDKLVEHRRRGTSFYGVQIGENPSNVWHPYFEIIYKVGYMPPMKH
ncbi:MAG: hypothetical protein MJZ15_09655 [Bacteroidales bacterium]|nr:hypothetical protein [Bacteroidales bacterium]